MAIIVNSAWKSQKDGAIVKFKGEEYEIGSTAFGSLEAAVAAGETSDLVIVDKKLTSPVKKENITGAATDIFASTVKETESADGKTYTKTIKFTAAAGGTASFKDDDAELIGFEKVTATAAGGSFKAGKQDISSSVKEVNDSDKGIESIENSAAVSSTATGSLSVTSKAGAVSASVAAIADSEGETDEVISIIKDAYKGATGNDYEEKTAATYASVTLKNAEISTPVNGGVVTEKATVKTSDTNGEKINAEYTYSATSKIGSGTATLTDTSADAISGFKTVKISTSAAAATVGGLNAENVTADYSVKTAYVADQSFSYTGTSKETETSAGSLTITGKNAKEVEVDGQIEGFTSMNLKYATVNDEIEADAESSTSSLAIAVKNQKDVASLTATYSSDSTRTADGSLTAANSVIGNLDGVKAVTISNSTVNGTADAINSKVKTTKKETGVAVAGISDNAADYVDNFFALPGLDVALIDQDQAYTVDYASKREFSAGGTSFKLSGKAAADSVVAVEGYKTVALDNTDATNTLTATLLNDSSVTDIQAKISFVPESSYSDSNKITNSDKAFGDASIKGRTTVTTADGFASVKVAGTAGKTALGSVTGQNTASSTNTTATTIKAGKENPVGTYTDSITSSSKAASTLDASKVALSGASSALKTAKLQGVTGTATFSGAVDSDTKSSIKKDWNAEEISVTEAAKAALLNITDEEITAWNESNDSKRSAAGTFSLKNAAEIVAVTANNFKSVDVVGNIGKTTLTAVNGQNTVTNKSSESLTVNATKGTYSSSDTGSTQAATTLTVSKASLGTTFGNLKTVKLTDAAADATATFAATVDSDNKSSKKFDWNTEEATLLDIMTPGPEFGINNPSITSWTESNESKDSASGTFTLKNSNTTDATVIANGFKSVDVSGAIDHTVLAGVSGQDTLTDKSSKSLSVNKGKGSYSDSTATSRKAATTLNVSKANVKGAFTDLKTVTLNDIKVADAATFTASLDSDFKSSEKVEWNAEEVSFAELTGPYDENVTSWTSSTETKDSVVGSFTLKKATLASTVGIEDFKTVDISGVTAITATSLVNAGDSSSKNSLKRTASETKRTQEASNSATQTSVGSLKLTGTTADPLVLTMGAGTIGYSTITLKDARINTTADATAVSYAISSSYSAKESVTLDSGSPVTADLKVSKSWSKKGNGSFTASGSNAFTAFNGNLNGYSISLNGKISIGDVDNYKYDGRFADTYAVPFNGEYFDVIAVNAGAEPAPGDEEILRGNISGSYSKDKSGQITSKWTASYATIANGSFTQTATDKNVIAGDIIGYDKVTLTGVKTANDIDGTNTENSTVLNYKYAKDEEVANLKVVTASITSASSLKVTGKTFAGELQAATVDGDIAGYKSVTLQDAAVTGTITAEDRVTVTTTDLVNSPDAVMISNSSEAIGSLTATASQLEDAVSGFEKVELKNVTGSDDVDFAGGDSSIVTLGLETISDVRTATGSFSAVSTEKNKAPKDVKLNVLQEVGDIVGYQKVEVKDYIAGAVSVGFAANNFGGKAVATSIEVIAEDEEKETPKTWKKAAVTKGNTFSATADNYVEADEAHRNAVTVTSVTGYGKVEATGLSSIGAITNASIKDSVDPGVFADRFYSATHYGDWTATAKEEEGKYSAISVTAGSSATIKGIAADTAAPTAVTGNVLGYTNVKMDTVTLGNGAAVTYAGGKYTYATKTNSDDEVIATSTSTADGKLDIKNATFVASTTFGVEGFKTVAVDIAGKAAFTSIIGGTEVAQFTGDALDYTTYKLADKATVATEDGSVAGKVAGFVDVFFADTNFADTSEIFGYEIGTKKVDGELVQTYTAKAAVTFDNTDDDTKTLEGKITNARSIVFKSSVADAGVDFAVTGEITSLASEVGGITSGDLTIEIDKSQISLDLSKLALDDGDVINMISSTGAEKTATIALGDIADIAALEGMIADINDVAFTGAGNITFGTIDEQEFADTLDANGITWGENITFNGAHYDPTLV